MFDSSRAFSGFAVEDVDEAARFYTDTLGMQVAREHGMLRLQVGGGAATVLVYPKAGHVPASYTVLNFPVADVEASVDELSGRGVEFLQYDGFDQDDKGIFHGGGPLIAWFKDPSGNVFSVVAAD
jgi:catechol 2,3-dioxygenase-like lactoylglutathione lyase family enzyme